MSVFFGIALESEIWMQSLPENCASQNLPLIWEKLEKIAEEKELAKLSHFLIEDKELYEEALEAIDEFYDPDHEVYRQAMQEKLEDLAGQPEWFSPAEAGIAIRTMRGLIKHLRNNSDLFIQYGNEAGEAIIADLEGFASFLGKVESRNIRFSFWMQ